MDLRDCIGWVSRPIFAVHDEGVGKQILCVKSGWVGQKVAGGSTNMYRAIYYICIMFKIKYG